MKIWIKSILKFLIFSGVLCVAFGFAMEFVAHVGQIQKGSYIVLASAPVLFAFVGACLYKTFYGTRQMMPTNPKQDMEYNRPQSTTDDDDLIMIHEVR